MSISTVAPDRSNTASALAHLARMCREAEARLRQAADLSLVDALRNLLLRCARERARFAHQLEIEAQALGGCLVSSGSGQRPRAPVPAFSSDAHRVEACRAGEEATLAEYERVLRGSLPIELERLLRGHYAAIKDALGGIERVANAVA